MVLTFPHLDEGFAPSNHLLNNYNQYIYGTKHMGHLRIFQLSVLVWLTLPRVVFTLRCQLFSKQNSKNS